MIGSLSPGRGWEFFSSPPAIQWVPAVKQLGYEADHSPPLMPRSRICGAILSLPQYIFITLCSIEAQGQLYLYILPYLIYWNMTA
jgi:hypothetical protein